MYQYIFELDYRLDSCDECPLREMEECGLDIRLKVDYIIIPNGCPLKKIDDM